MTRVKICGLTNAADAKVAIEAGADLVGFIFYKPSPRYVSPEVVRSIVLEQKVAQSQTTVFVGVFVDEPAESIRDILEFCDLDAAQLHGDEPPEMLAQLGQKAYKALRPQSAEDARLAIDKYQMPVRATGENGVGLSTAGERASGLPDFLLDAYHPTLYGGTGRVTDWTMAADISRQHAILLAGSLAPENVAEAIDVVRPWGVDVSSGVEAGKGRKDHKKIRAFIRNVKG